MSQRKILTFSEVLFSTDKNSEYPAANIVHTPCQQSWLSSKNNKSGRLVGEFLLDDSSQIEQIRICNHKCHKIEILVGHTKGKKRRPKYESYLPTYTLYPPPDDPTSGEGRLGIFKFTEDDFDKTCFKKKWNCIKVILTNLAREKEFGITLLRLYGEVIPFVDPTEFLNMSIEKIDIYDENESSDEDEEEKKAWLLRKKEREKKEKAEFKEEVRNFFKEKRDPVYFMRFTDYFDEFELHRDYPLTTEQKHIMYDIYEDERGVSRFDDREKFFAFQESHNEVEADYFAGLYPKTSDLLKAINMKKQAEKAASCSTVSTGTNKSGSSKRPLEDPHASPSKKMCNKNKPSSNTRNNRRQTTDHKAARARSKQQTTRTATATEKSSPSKTAAKKLSQCKRSAEIDVNTSHAKKLKALKNNVLKFLEQAEANSESTMKISKFKNSEFGNSSKDVEGDKFDGAF